MALEGTSDNFSSVCLFVLQLQSIERLLRKHISNEVRKKKEKNSVTLALLPTKKIIQNLKFFSSRKVSLTPKVIF